MTKTVALFDTRVQNFKSSRGKIKTLVLFSNKDAFTRCVVSTHAVFHRVLKNRT